MAVSDASRDRVVAVCRCDLRLAAGVWDYAQANASAIDVAWHEAVGANPQFFNGIVHLIDALSITGDTLEAQLLRTDFKSYLYWRQAGFPPAGVLDGFGSALIRSADGAILLGRQRVGNVNGGLVYLPGGFIDVRDVDGNGAIDIRSSIVRELEEETGLTPANVEMQPGCLVTEAGAHVSIAMSFHSKLDAQALKAAIEKQISADPSSELDEIVIVRAQSDLLGLAMPRYARVVVNAVLQEPFKAA
jgi:8-oxo-dGTP pyrophosphatase MutT (NUDIX family)